MTLDNGRTNHKQSAIPSKLLQVLHQTNNTHNPHPATMPAYNRNPNLLGPKDEEDDEDDLVGFVPISLSPTQARPTIHSANKEKEKKHLKAKEKKIRAKMEKNRLKQEAEKEGRRQAFEGSVSSQIEAYQSSKKGKNLLGMSVDQLTQASQLMDESASLMEDVEADVGALDEMAVPEDDPNFVNQMNAIKETKQKAAAKEKSAFLDIKRRKEEKKKRKKDKEKEKESAKSEKKEKKERKAKEKAEREKVRVDAKANFKQREKEHKEYLKRKKEADKEKKRKQKEEKALEKERKRIEQLAQSALDEDDSNNDSSGSSRALLGGGRKKKNNYSKQGSSRRLSIGRRMSNGLGLFKNAKGTTHTMVKEESIRTRNGVKPRTDVLNLWNVDPSSRR